MTWGPFAGTTFKHIYIDGIEQDAFGELWLSQDGAKNSFHVLSITGLMAGSNPGAATFSLENWSGKLTPPSTAVVDASCTVMAE